MPVSRSTPAAPSPAPLPPPLQAAASGVGSAPCLPDAIKLPAMAGTRTTGWDVLPAQSILAGVRRQQSSQALHHTGQQDTCSTFGFGQATHAEPAQPSGLARHDLTTGAASGLDQPAVSSAGMPGVTRAPGCQHVLAARAVPMSCPPPCHQQPMHPMQLLGPPQAHCLPTALLSPAVTNSHSFAPPLQPPPPMQPPAATAPIFQEQGGPCTHQKHKRHYRGTRAGKNVQQRRQAAAAAAAAATAAHAVGAITAAMEASVTTSEEEGEVHPTTASMPPPAQLPDAPAPPSPLSAVRDRKPAALGVPATSQLPDAPAPPSPLSDLRNVATLSPTWSPPGTPSPVLPPSRQPSLDGHACLPVNHNLSPPCQQASELQGEHHQPAECAVSGIKQEPEQQAWVPCQVDAQGSQPQQVARAGRRMEDVAEQHPTATSEDKMTCPAGPQQTQPHQVLMQAADASAQQQAKVTAPTAQQQQRTHEPWGGLSCYELWSACAYAVQGVVQQVCGGTPPSPGGLDACLAAVQLHGFLIRLAAGWWADPGAALEWLAAGFPQLSSAVPAVGRVLEAAQAVHCCGLNPDTIANMSGSNTSRKGESNPHLSSQQLQYCLHCLSDTLQRAGASEQEILHLLSSVAGQLGTERACASRCIAALHQGVMSEKTCRGAINRGSKRSLDGDPVTTAGCAGHTLLCKPCLSGRCHQQLVIAVAGAEGLGLLGVGHVCLVDWVSNAMALEA
jgi:hypothetical protein